MIRIREDIDGNIWIGLWESGLSRYDGVKFTNFTADAVLGIRVVSAICQDKNGILWFAGLLGGGLSSYDGKSFHRYTKDDGLLDDRIMDLIIDDKNKLWIGTHTGISCYDGRSFKNYTTEDGLLGD
jgi:ligand-binding sensor domain-containing protein